MPRPYDPSPPVPADCLWFGAKGLHIGREPVPSDMLEDLATRGGEGHARLETLLAVVFGKLLSPAQLHTVLAAAAISRRGDQGLANIRLATSRMVRIPDAVSLAERLALADRMLARGLSAADVLQTFKFDGLPGLLEKYDPDQPRVPAGNGRVSGRFGSGGGGSDAAEANDETGTTSAPVRVASAAMALRAVSGPSFLAPTVSAEALAALGTLAVALGGAAAVFGTLFVPRPNNTSTSGSLPGGQGLSYAYDHDEGVLRLFDADGKIIAVGPRDESGIFHDVDNGVAIGRDIGGTIVFEQASMVATADRTEVISHADTNAVTANDNQPRLCPDPMTEKPNGASLRARAYQEQISAMVNPLGPLTYGLAVAFFNKKTGKWVKLDDCDHQTGALIEAKGPGFARNLKYDFLKKNYMDGFVRQARAQAEAAGPRAVIWYFAERATANDAAEAFASQPDLVNKIRVRYVEAIAK